MPKFSDSQLDFMRLDLAANGGYSKLIDKAKELLKQQGRDFDKEFLEWKRQQTEAK